MRDVIEKLITDYEEIVKTGRLQSAKPVQIGLANGTAIAGVPKRGPNPGVCIIQTVMRNSQGGGIDAIEMLVSIDSIVSIAVPVEPSPIVAPGATIVPPNAH